jgi:hypothetical protein
MIAGRGRSRRARRLHLLEGAKELGLEARSALLGETRVAQRPIPIADEEIVLGQVQMDHGTSRIDALGGQQLCERLLEPPGVSQQQREVRAGAQVARKNASLPSQSPAARRRAHASWYASSMT